MTTTSNIGAESPGSIEGAIASNPLNSTPGPWTADFRNPPSIEGPGDNGTVVELPMWLPEFRAERDANARLIAAAPELYEALVHAAAQFRYYENLHREKNTPDGDEKAWRNHEMAERCELAIAKARGETA